MGHTEEPLRRRNLKHTIEPFLNVQYTSGTNDIAQIIQFDGIDSAVAGAQLTYGVTNRFYAKRTPRPGAPAQSTEIIDVSLTQSYYNNPDASIYDHQYQTTGYTAPSNYSPIALSVRALPATSFNATVSAEIDSHYLKLRTISAQAQYNWSNILQTSLQWSKRAYIQGLTGFDDCRTQDPACIAAGAASLDHYISPQVNVHTGDNSVGTVHTSNT